MTLTNSQQEQYNYILGCIHDAVAGKPYTPKIVSLEGPAGSGKTTLTSKIINNILGKYTIKVTATTHKALKVLRDMLQLPENIQTSTIHSHLALKMQTNYITGDMDLVQDTKKTVPSIDVLFCDESSMASDTLFKHAEHCVERRQAKIIVFIGDKFQLAPVEGGYCPIFDINYRYQLTEVVRQAADNPIIQLATEIRGDIESKNYRNVNEIIKLFKKYESEHIIIPKDKNELFTRFFDNIETKEKQICTYTNKAMNNYNKFCRNIIKQNPKDDFIISDEIVFLEHHTVGDEIVHANNEVVKIVSCELKEYFGAPDIMYWECRDEKNRIFNVVDSLSTGNWNKFLGDLSYIAKSLPPKERRDAWRNFYSNKQFMSPVAFTYAATVHKCQGSSFDEMYVDVDEILSALRYQEQDMIFRLLYVACTRPKDKLVLKINI